jgi:hypothetical protein
MNGIDKAPVNNEHHGHDRNGRRDDSAACRRLGSIDINEVLIQGNGSWDQEDRRKEENLADEVQNKRLRIPP